MPYIEDLGSRGVRVVGDPRLANEDNPDDNNDHLFGSWATYYRTLREPRQHRQPGKTVDELLSGPQYPLMGGMEGESLT